MSRWDGLRNESVYERCGMRGRGSEVGCVVVEWVRRSTLRLFGHIERMENVVFVKKVYLSNVEGPRRRGRPLGRLEDRVKEYMSDRGVRQGGSVWIERGGGPFAMATHLGDVPEGSESSELLIDRLIDKTWCTT